MPRTLSSTVAAVAFLLLGAGLSSLFAHPLATLRQEVFRTNCLLLHNVNLTADTPQEPPKICNTIDTLLPVSLFAGGTLLLLVGFTTTSCLLNFLNLIAVAALYCNPTISSSFNTTSHLLQLAICAAALLTSLLREDQKSEAKTHRE